MDGEDYKTCKGVKKYVVKKRITHDDYKDCLFTNRERLRKMNVFRSYHLDIYSMEVNKIALSADDDKRVILDNCIHTLAYAHYRNKEYVLVKYKMSFFPNPLKKSMSAVSCYQKFLCRI